MISSHDGLLMGRPSQRGSQWRDDSSISTEAKGSSIHSSSPDPSPLSSSSSQRTTPSAPVVASWPSAQRLQVPPTSLSSRVQRLHLPSSSGHLQPLPRRPRTQTNGSATQRPFRLFVRRPRKPSGQSRVHSPSVVRNDRRHWLHSLLFRAQRRHMRSVRQLYPSTTSHGSGRAPAEAAVEQTSSAKRREQEPLPRSLQHLIALRCGSVQARSHACAVNDPLLPIRQAQPTRFGLWRWAQTWLTARDKARARTTRYAVCAGIFSGMKSALENLKSVRSREVLPRTRQLGALVVAEANGVNWVTCKVAMV